MEIQAPNTNRGLSRAGNGTRQEEFGADRGDNFAFPTSAMKWQAAQDDSSSQAIIAANFLMMPTEYNADVTWDVGTFVFVKKDRNYNKSISCLSMFRHNMYVGAAASFATSSSTSSSTSFLTSKQKSANIMATLDGIAENFEPLGVCIGPTSPSLMQSVTDNLSTIKYSGALKTVGVVISGHTPFPNVFDTELRAGSKLYFMIKPTKPQDRIRGFTNDTVYMPKAQALHANQLTCDTVFFSRKDASLPDRCSAAVMRALLDNKGDQPPLDDLNWIQWTVDTKGTVIRGEVQPALLYQIGTCLHFYPSTNKAHGPPKKAILQYLPDFRTLPMIEISLELKRIY